MIVPVDERKIVIIIHLLWSNEFEKHIFLKKIWLDLGNELQHNTILNKTWLAQELSKLLLEAYFF